MSDLDKTSNTWWNKTVQSDPVDDITSLMRVREAFAKCKAEPDVEIISVDEWEARHTSNDE